MESGGGKQRAKYSVHFRCKDVLEGHSSLSYVVTIARADRRKVMGRESVQISHVIINCDVCRVCLLSE